MTFLRSEISSGICTKLHTMAASNNKDHASQSLLLLLARATYIMVLLLAFIPFVVNHTFNATPPESLQQHPLLCRTNHIDRRFFVWRLTLARPPHTGHSTILLRSEIPSGICASFAPWQQVTIEIMRRNLSYYCLHALHIYNGVILRVHPVEFIFAPQHETFCDSELTTKEDFDHWRK